jgi:hypothetical protein
MHPIAASPHGGAEQSLSAAASGGAPSHSRRAVVRTGAKLAFMAPVLTTFFASDARAAGSNHSCYPASHLCDGTHTGEECCPGLTCLGTVGSKTCQ